MNSLKKYINDHTQIVDRQTDDPNVIDVGYCGVRIVGEPDAETLKKLVSDRKGGKSLGWPIEPFNGDQHYIHNVKAWLGDDEAAHRFMGLAHALKLGTVVTPQSLYPNDTPKQNASLLNLGMVHIQRPEEAAIVEKTGLNDMYKYSKFLEKSQERGAPRPSPMWEPQKWRKEHASLNARWALADYVKQHTEIVPDREAAAGRPNHRVGEITVAINGEPSKVRLGFLIDEFHKHGDDSMHPLDGKPHSSVEVDKWLGDDTAAVPFMALCTATNLSRLPSLKQKYGVPDSRLSARQIAKLRQAGDVTMEAWPEPDSLHPKENRRGRKDHPRINDQGTDEQGQNR